MPELKPFAMPLNKNTAISRIFILLKEILGALCHGTNALGAEGLLNFLAVLNHSDLLKIGFESPVCSSQRETAVVTEGRCFPTGIALCHFLSSFPYNYRKIE